MRGRLFESSSATRRREVFSVQFLVWPILLVFAAGILGVRLNLTASIPILLYLISSYPEAQLFEFCPPEPFGTLSVQRGYRSQSNACPDGGQPLLKPIVAHEGDLVETSEIGVSVNGLLLPHSSPQYRDTDGRSISAWQFGKFSVGPGMVWVVSSYNPRSFDSRYFGSVPLTSIIHRLRPLWTAQ